MTLKMKFIAIAGAVAVVAVGAAAVVVAAAGGDEDRQALVAERGREVMPFDLERTTHRFEKLADGGVQTVVSDDGDREQIGLVRTHLRKEARLFRQGVFTDPITIHGPDMPGVAELKAGASRIDVAYSDAPRGGRIRYRTDDPALIDAIHRWFDAQTTDHGDHA